MGRLYDVLVESATAGRALQDEEGRMPAGHNGPWNDPETPVRNTAHWSITFLKAYEITGDEEFRKAAVACFDYLCSEEARPHGQTFYHRKSDRKDSCNGLIGQAWTIEALVAGGVQLDRPDLIELAADVFLLHPFDRILNTWATVEIDGTVQEIDLTLNHQIWFAAAGGLLTRCENCPSRITREIRAFLDGVDGICRTNGAGLINHLLKPGWNVRKQLRIQRQNIRGKRVPKPILKLYRPGTGELLEQKAIGYHSFNLYGLALLYEVFPNHRFWQTETFRSATNYATSDPFLAALETNSYGYPYNCSGLELAYAYLIFACASEESVAERVRIQLANHYNHEQNLLSERTADSNTLAARLYEATRLPNVQYVEPET